MSIVVIFFLTILFLVCVVHLPVIKQWFDIPFELCPFASQVYVYALVIPHFTNTLSRWSKVYFVRTVCEASINIHSVHVSRSSQSEHELFQRNFPNEMSAILCFMNIEVFFNFHPTIYNQLKSQPIHGELRRYFFLSSYLSH